MFHVCSPHSLIAREQTQTYHECQINSTIYDCMKFIIKFINLMALLPEFYVITECLIAPEGTGILLAGY